MSSISSVSHTLLFFRPTSSIGTLFNFQLYCPILFSILTLVYLQFVYAIFVVIGRVLSLWELSKVLLMIHSKSCIMPLLISTFNSSDEKTSVLFHCNAESRLLTTWSSFTNVYEYYSTKLSHLFLKSSQYSLIFLFFVYCVDISPQNFLFVFSFVFNFLPELFLYASFIVAVIKA